MRLARLHRAGGAIRSWGRPAKPDIAVFGVGDDEILRPVPPGANVGELSVKSGHRRLQGSCSGGTEGHCAYTIFSLLFKWRRGGRVAGAW